MDMEPIKLSALNYADNFAMANCCGCSSTQILSRHQRFLGATCLVLVRKLHHHISQTYKPTTVFHTSIVCLCQFGPGAARK